MSANINRICKHCGRDVVPVGHLCEGKAKAIRIANENYTNRMFGRIKQRWDDLRKEWVHVM